MVAHFVDGRDAFLRVALVDALHDAAPDAAGVAEALPAVVLVAFEAAVRVPHPDLVVGPRKRPMMSLTQLSNCLTLGGSFSSVSTATIARKGAFCSIF